MSRTNCAAHCETAAQAACSSPAVLRNGAQGAPNNKGVKSHPQLYDMFTHINTGLPLTAEVNAHHLTWADEDVPDGATLFKCMPPLRDRGNQEALWQGLQVGYSDSSAL